MVCLVDDQDVERVPSTGLRIVRLRVHVAEQSLRPNLGQPRHAHDHPREDLKWVGLKTVRAADPSHQLGVQDRELQAELLPHLVLPLQRKAGRAHDHGRAGAVPQEQLLDNKARLDRLAEAHIVSKQQVRTWRSERAAERFELIRLDIRAGPERRLVTVRIGARHGSPPHRVDEARKSLRLVEAIRVDHVEEPLSGRNDMAELRYRLVSGAARQPLRPHIRDCPGRPTHFDDLPRLWECWDQNMLV